MEGDAEDQALTFVYETTLQDRALVNIAVSMWLHEDSLKVLRDIPVISSSCLQDDFHKKMPEESKLNLWLVGKERIRQKVDKLPLPMGLKCSVLIYIDVIGWQLFAWKEIYSACIGKVVCVGMARNIQWTSFGTIDGRKTATAICADESLAGYEKCLISTMYSAVKDMEAWHKKCNISRDNFPCTSNPDFCENERAHSLKSTAEAFCPDIKVPYTDDSIHMGFLIVDHSDGLKFFIENQSSVNAKYLEKMACVCVSQITYERFLWGHLSDCIVFLLSKMNKEQQLKSLLINPPRALELFLEWPWQRFFLKVAACMLPYMQFEQVSMVVRHIKRYAKQKKDFDYVELQKRFLLIGQEFFSCHDLQCLNAE